MFANKRYKAPLLPLLPLLLYLECLECQHLVLCTSTLLWLCCKGRAVRQMPESSLCPLPARVFYKHRDNNFFPPAAYVGSFVLTQIPQSVIECIIYSLGVYWVRLDAPAALLAGRGNPTPAPAPSDLVSCRSLGLLAQLATTLFLWLLRSASATVRDSNGSCDCRTQTPC